ncbi:hypothetical protein Dfri01_55940 [Dyadobacter frigoris]|uniref:Uncharacterized protein n=2 Tax=Dyadobacter frigoris TaxID=2576211 RepID=A0A4U6D3T8_9BACT|nr:hypothetical protein FDK13_18470 [Dyadobacter frigoris]GLU56133.1 hypothetical protein Dfri01_55940 [Dyadobacter frigoris]
MILSVGTCASVFAQVDGRIDSHIITVVVPQVALLDLESSSTKDFTATFVAPTEAGNKLDAPQDNITTWLNYSSIQTSTTPKRVDVKAAPVITGLDIHLVAAIASAGTVGAKGTPNAGITLSTADQPLITAIGSAYTLNGANNGHQLTYSFDTVLDNANYGALRSGSTAVTVTYTLVDN